MLNLLGAEVSMLGREGWPWGPILTDGGVATGVEGVLGVAMVRPLHFVQRPDSSPDGVLGQLPWALLPLLGWYL